MLIYAPSRCAADTEGSTSDSTEFSQMLAQSVTWKTKFLPPQSWQRILRGADWMMRLFGPISRRLTLARGGAELMRSWAATLASRSVFSASAEEQKTIGTCGHTLQESWTLSGPESASLKTSGGTFDWDCPKCLENSEALATELAQAYSRRRKSAHRTDGSESSFWPTARAGKAGSEDQASWQARADKGNVSTPPLGLAVNMWATPNTGDATRGSPETNEQKKARGGAVIDRPNVADSIRTGLQGHAGDEPAEARGPRSNRSATARGISGSVVDNAGSDGVRGRGNKAFARENDQGQNENEELQTARPCAGVGIDERGAEGSIREMGFSAGSSVGLRSIRIDRAVQEREGVSDSWPAGPGQEQKGFEAPRTIEGKLNPSWVAQLMGLPADWVEVPGLTREMKLRALGNGVVPQQAAHAIRTLFDLASNPG